MSYCGCDQFSVTVQTANESTGVGLVYGVDPGCPYVMEMSQDGEAFEPAWLYQAENNLWLCSQDATTGVHALEFRMPHMEYWIREINIAVGIMKAFFPAMANLRRCESMTLYENHSQSGLVGPWEAPVSILRGIPLKHLDMEDGVDGWYGPLSSFAGMPLEYLRITNGAGPNGGLIGSLSDLGSCPIEHLWLNKCPGLDFSSLGDLHHLKDFDFTGNTRSDAAWTAMLADAYVHRMEFLNPVGYYLDTLPGTYQNSAVPATANEYLFKLVNDPDNEGFPHWFNNAP